MPAPTDLARTTGPAVPVTTSPLDVFEPASLEEAMWLARTFHASGLLPKGVGSAEGAFTIIATGHELGLSPMAALRSIHVFDGKPILSAALLAGIVQRKPSVCAYFQLVESSDKVATYETHRVGHAKPIRMSFTIEQAERAGLLGKDNWRKYPAAMLRARASAELARAVYPDIVGGLYDPDELNEDPPPPPILGASVGQPIAQDPPPAKPAAAAPSVATVEKLAARIAAAKDEAELKACSEEVTAAIAAGEITPADRAALVKAWSKRRAEVRKAAAPTEAPPPPEPTPPPASGSAPGGEP